MAIGIRACGDARLHVSRLGQWSGGWMRDQTIVTSRHESRPEHPSGQRLSQGEVFAVTGGSGHTGQAVLPPFSGERLAHGGERVIHGGERPPHKGERATQGGECAAHSRKRSAHNSERSAHSSERPAHAGELSVHSSERASHAGERADQSGERPVHDGERAAHGGDRPAHSGERAGQGGRGGLLPLLGRGRGRPPKLYRIGEVVEYSGLSRQTIHNYTAMGLIRESRWTNGGHRLYDESVFERLDQVAQLKAQGRSMEYIREYFVQLDAS